MPRDTILFDINETALDLNSLQSVFKAAFDDEGVSATWFAMLLHSSTVCALTGVKSDFASLAETTLDALAARLKVPLPDTTRDEILGEFARLPSHPDIKPALARLRSAGYRTVAFTNSSLNLVTKQVQHAGLADDFDDIVSVEKTGTFKPDATAYLYVAGRLRRPIEELRLVATHDWDTHGAMAAGMLAAYIDRSGAPYHPLYRKPDIFETTMDGVVDQIIARDGDR